MKETIETKEMELKILNERLTFLLSKKEKDAKEIQELENLRDLLELKTREQNSLSEKTEENVIENKNEENTVREREKEEKINLLISQIAERIKIRKETKEKIALLIQERNKLLEEKSTGDEVLSTDNEITILKEEIEALEETLAKNEPKRVLLNKKIDALVKEIEGLEELIKEKPFFWKKWSYENKILKLESLMIPIQDEKNIIYREISKTENNLNSKRNELENIIKKIKEKEKRERDVEEIKNDEKERPFVYYLAKKNENPYLDFKNSEGLIDIRNSSWASSDNIIGNYDYLQYINESREEGYFTFSFSGFILVIKNVKSLRHENYIDSESNEAIYKIIGPDGKITNDNIKGYDKARSLFSDVVYEHKNKAEEEFNNLSK